MVKMTRRTVLGHVRLEGIFINNKNGGTQMPLPDDQMQESDWWNQTHVPSHRFGEQERSGRRPAPADSSEASGQSVQPSPPMPMQLMNTPCHPGVHSESNVPDHLWDWWKDAQQRQWLQVQPWNNADSWNQYGIVGSPTGRQQDHICDQWNRLNADDWNRWSTCSARRGHSGTVNRRNTLTRGPPPEWDGNRPEKTWRDYRRTLKQWLSTTVPPERHGVLLWRALTGDAKLLISHFRDEDLSISTSLGTRMIWTMLSTNCTASATRRYCSLRMRAALKAIR